MITAITRVLLSTRVTSLSPTGRTSPTFHVNAGTVTPLGRMLAGPLAPTPPVPEPPERIYNSLPGRNERREFSMAAQRPWLLPGACGIMLVIRNVAELSGIVEVRSADGHMCPRSKPVSE